jgi:hypothetical protein
VTFRKNIIHVIVALTLLLSVSCSRQKSPDIENSEIRNSREIERLEACTLVNFDSGVFLHLNTIYLFKCAKWDEEFPSLFRSIKKIPRDSWDHVMAPIDKTFIENLTRRDRVFKYIRDLDKQEGLDDLSRVIVALNEKNFFDSVKLMFQCVENPGQEICAAREAAIPPKKSLKNIIKLVDTSPAVIDSLSVVVQAFNKAMDKDQERLRNEVLKFIHDPVFVSMRLNLVDAFAHKAQIGLTAEDRTFLGKLFLTGNKTKKEPWIYTWIHSDKMNREKFRDLVEYPILANPQFLKEIQGLKAAYDNGFNCTIRSTVNPNDLIGFDFKNHLADYVTVIRDKDYKTFIDFSSADIVGLKMSAEVCKELESNKFDVNFIKMLSSFSNLMGEKKFYELIKFLTLQTTARRDRDKTFAENLYLFDLAASRIFSGTTSVNEQIIKHTREFYPTLYDVILSLSPEAFLNLGLVFNDFLKEEHALKQKGVADFWSFFSPVEKNYVFNFIDRHFEDNTNYVLLFEFYGKMLDEIREVQPYFKEKWVENENIEEQSYLALQDFFYQLAGVDTLKDFKTFFGRDHILRILEIISSGTTLNQSAKEELEYIRSNEYIARARSDRYKFSVSYHPGVEDDYNSRAVLDCMQKFSEIENGFYQMVRKLPDACTKVTKENIAFRLFGWLNAIEEEYHAYKSVNSISDSLLSDKGLLSPYMLNSTIGTAKIVDELLGDIDSKLPTSNGVRYLMNSARFHLVKQGAVPLIEKNLDVLEKWFKTNPEQNAIHRNALLKMFTRNDNFSASSDVLINISDLSIGYSDWVKRGELAKAQSRSLGEYDPAHDCEKIINKVVAPNPCPSKEVVKKHLNASVNYLTTSWDPKVGSPITRIIKGMIPGEGVDIPLRGKNTKKYLLTLKETFKYLYDTSDKSLPINRQNVLFESSNGKVSNETLTTIERVELVIRDVRFENNYLGAAFLNAVVQAEDYNEEAEKRKKLLLKCIKIPVIRCSRKMSYDDLRMAKNSLNAIDSLIDINNGRGLDARMTYGNYLKAFEQTLVESSHIDAQVVNLLPLKNELLLKHNGRMLAETTLLSTWSNVGRVIRDRVGRTRTDFDKFINSEAFNRVDKSLAASFTVDSVGPSADRLLKKTLLIPKNETQNLLENTVDWIASLDYSQTRLLEDTLARLLLVSAYLGPPEKVFPESFRMSDRNTALSKRYKDNNILQMVLALEKIVDYWPTLKNYYPQDMKLIDAFKPLNTALVFVTDLLESTKVPEKNIAYKALNDLFLIFQTSVLEELSDPKIASLSNAKSKGLDLVLEFFDNPKNVTSTYFVLRDNYHYADKLHVNNAEWFKVFGQNMKRISNDERVDFTPFRDYLKFTTKSAVCLDDKSDCLPNYHFDEASSLVIFLNKKSKGTESNFAVMTKKLLVENFDQLTSMIDDLMPALKIKEVKPPLKFP